MSPVPERNPVTHAAHRREVFWQITVPVIVGALIVLGLIVLAILGSSGAVSRWAAISTIWLIVPLLIVGLILLVIVAGLAYGIIWVVGVLPGYARQVQDFFVLLSARVKQISDQAVEPVIKVQSFTASIAALKRSFRSK